jgi:hypothetical protein
MVQWLAPSVLQKCFQFGNGALLGQHGTIFKGQESKKSGMETIGYPETSARNYHYSLRNNPEERSSHLLHGGSLISRMVSVSFKEMQTEAKYM